MTTTATVLAVDDETELVELYSDFLSTEYEVYTATSGAGALATVDDAVDVVSLDRRMPEMTGEAVLDELRTRGVDCQVAMLTAVEPDGDILDVPFDDYRTKPVARSELVGLVKSLLERATYDERTQELFRLASKKATLEATDRDHTDEHDRLARRIETLREEIRSIYDGLDPKAAFKQVLAD